MSVTVRLTWSSIAETITLAVAELEEGESLRADYLEAADSIASAFGQASSAGVKRIHYGPGSSSSIVQRFTAVDRIFDEQPATVKLVVWATYALIFEEDASDEVQARLLNAGGASGLAKALHLRVENVHEQDALKFAKTVFSVKDADVVAS